MSSADANARDDAPDPSRRSLIGLALWLAVLAVTAYYFATASLDPSRVGSGGDADPRSPEVLQGYGRVFLGLISAYWYWIALIALVILMIAGQLGAGLGIPGLFRDPPPPRPDQGGAIRGEKGRRSQGGFGAGFWGALGTTVLIAQAWTAIYYAERINHLSDYTRNIKTEDGGRLAQFVVDFADLHELLLFLAKTCPPFVAMVVLAFAIPAPAPGVRRLGQGLGGELLRNLLGVVVGAAVVGLLAWLGGLLHSRVLATVDPVHAAPQLWTISQFPARYDEVKALVMTSFALFFAIYVVAWFVLIFFFRDSLSPGLGIGAVLSGVVMLFAVLGALAPAVRVPVVAAVVVALAWTNSNAYKYRFPGMGDYYRRRNRIALAKVDPDAPPPPMLLRDAEVLEAWRGRQPGPGKPKLLLVAVTGGAYRASFWTAVVLDELCNDPKLPGFARGIRLLTGASGGMVGASYFAAGMAPEGPRPGGVVERLREESQLDSLTPVVRHLIRRDLPLTVWPLWQRVDRGVVLDRQWASLGVSFADLREGERQGWRPSLIVSPMIVETGRRLLISNLDLHNLAETTSETHAQVSRPGDASARSTDPNFHLYSRSADQFYRLFPEAHATFPLATAVRMNASFPYASPAVSLPTDPPRRVVDAGYYDNYGVDVATVWAYLNRDWIAANTSGLALVQIRAYESEAIRKDLYVPARDDPPAGWAARRIADVRTSLQWLTSPAEGVISARDWSMSFRNDEQVRILDDHFNGSNGRFFEAFVFENPTDFGMNWFVSDDDIAAMRRSIGGIAEDAPARRRAAGKNADERARLAAWWNRG